VQIDRANKRVEIRHLDSGASEWQSYDKLMLAPGPRRASADSRH
jgi:NADH dehydrogenase FAD-containing subunit